MWWFLQEYLDLGLPQLDTPLSSPENSDASTQFPYLLWASAQNGIFEAKWMNFDRLWGREELSKCWIFEQSAFSAQLPQRKIKSAIIID